MSLNQCNFIGNLGRDVEVRTFTNGDKVANMRLAVSEKWKDKQTGERKERTEWVSVAVFGPLAGIAEQYLRKGSKVFVSGKLVTRKWQNKEGQDQYSTEIVLQGPQAILTMLDGPSQRDDVQSSDTWSGYGGGYGSPDRGSSHDPLDDALPF